MDQDFLFELDELLSNGDFETAVEKIEELDEEEKTSEIKIMYAHALSQCGQYQEALDVLESYAEDASEDDLAYHLELAGVCFGLHRYRTAVSESKLCIEIDPDCVDAWLLLCMIYQETGDDAGFEEASVRAREIDEQAWESIYSDHLEEMELYNDDDLDIVLNYIASGFGRIVGNMPCYNDNEKVIDHPIKVVISKPSKNKDFYSLVTVGLGAYCANVESGEGNTIPVRTELVAVLPSSLHISEVYENYKWIAHVMRQFSEMIESELTWLGHGHTISYGATLDEAVGYDGVILEDIQEKLGLGECRLLDGTEVVFLQMRPLYEEELMFKIQNGHEALIEKLHAQLVLRADRSELAALELMTGIERITLDRPNCCEVKGAKHWAIPRSGMAKLIDWDGADGCFATDRITVDKCRVGFMYREEPDPSHPDSGWRFLAGDEDEDYMSDTSKMDIFNLNTICNYDPTVIEYLDSPVGTAYYRGPDGSFVKAKL